MSPPEVDLFGHPLDNTRTPPKNAFEVDAHILQMLVEERTAVDGPTHSKTGETKAWLPGRGAFRRPIVFIGYHPTDIEAQTGRAFSATQGSKLAHVLRHQVGEDLDEFYLTNLIKYPVPAGKAPPKLAANICRPYLLAELAKLQPETIVCLGSEVFAYLTGYDGGLEDYRGTKFNHPDFKAKVSVVWSPGAVIKNPDLEQIWVNDLKAVLDKLNVDCDTNWEEQDKLPVHFITNTKDLKAAVDRELSQGTSQFAIDTEFDGETWYEAHCFKLDISTREHTLDLHLLEPVQGYEPIMIEATKGRFKGQAPPEHAERMLFDSSVELERYLSLHPLRTKPIAAFLREYQWSFQGSREEVAHELNRLFRRPGVQVWGHNGRIDFKLMLKLGVNLFDHVDMDTITLALHLHESQPLGLEDISKRYLGAPNHKLELIHWLNTHRVLGGKLPYTFVPRKIIDPYAVADTRRTYDLRHELLKKLDQIEEQTVKKGEPSIKEAYFKYKMGQFRALAEMEIIGQPINLQALKTNIDWYDQQKKLQKRKCIDHVCEVTGWSEFNPSSPAQVEKLLFNKLGLTPLYSTDKPPVPWDKVAEMPASEQWKYTPSTNQETLETLALENNICAELNNTRILYTIAKSYLRKGARWADAPRHEVSSKPELELWSTGPVTPEIDSETEDDNETESEWEALSKDKKSRALSQIVHPNGYLYSSYFELLETHRLATKPNISAIPKGEGKYISEITGQAPPYEIRWLFQAPEEWVIAEADWVTGEVWLLMMLAGDPEGIKQVSDPDKYDIHSAMAKRMFPHIIPSDMPEIEVKKKFKKERDAAKPVTFGVPYQRGPDAIARQLNREAANNRLDVHYTRQDGDSFINAYRENFPRAWRYLEKQMSCVRSPKYQTSPWGFRRRYPDTNEPKQLNKYQREASNWQIQHGVACCMMSACNVWSELRKVNPDLPIFLVDILHDATKWLIHKSALDLAPRIISTVMGSGLSFPKQLTPYVPLRHEVTFFHQWGGAKIPDQEIATFSGQTAPPDTDSIIKAVPTFPYLQKMLT
jgi:uracil-DNA glycosylase family 4